MHTQVATAQWITQRSGHYLLRVKDNKKTIRRTLKALPWKDVTSISSVDTSHGRRVRRTIKTLEVPKWVGFPDATQVVQVRRTRTAKSQEACRGGLPGVLPAHGRRPDRDHRGLGPRALGHREPSPRRSAMSSSMRTATSCAPATDLRTWPPCVT